MRKNHVTWQLFKSSSPWDIFSKQIKNPFLDMVLLCVCNKFQIFYRFLFGKEAAYTAQTHTHATKAKKTHISFVSWILIKKKLDLWCYCR